MKINEATIEIIEERLSYYINEKLSHEEKAKSEKINNDTDKVGYHDGACDIYENVIEDVEEILAYIRMENSKDE